MKKIIITGNVGANPELRTDKNGNNFVTFSIGVSVGNKAKPKTDWVNVTCNGKLSELVTQFVVKGSKLLVEGFPGVNAYLSKQNEAMATLTVFANNIEFLNKKETNTENNEAISVDGLISDIPF